MRLSDSSYEEIKQEVACLFRSYHVTSFDALGAPLAERMGISLVPYSSLSGQMYGVSLYMSEDGFYLEHEGREYIYYNDERPRERIKWTVMHEIAHCVLGHTTDMDEAEREAEADFFAKYALAAPPVLHQLRVEDPGDVAIRCGISYEASYNAYEYYRTWLVHSGPEYQRYELCLLDLFGFSPLSGRENSIRPRMDDNKNTSQPGTL